MKELNIKQEIEEARKELMIMSSSKIIKIVGKKEQHTVIQLLSKMRILYQISQLQTFILVSKMEN